MLRKPPRNDLYHTATNVIRKKSVTGKVASLFLGLDVRQKISALYSLGTMETSLQSTVQL